MPQRSNEFQRLIARIEDLTVPRGCRVTESKLVPPLTGGKPREIDVAIHPETATRFAKSGTEEILVGIECRDWKRKAGQEWIDQIYGKYRDLPVARKIAVSRSGFTKGAIDQAKKYGIELLSLEEAQGTRWGDVTTNPNLPLVVARAPVVADLTILKRAGSSIPTDPFNTVLYSERAGRIGTVMEICRREMSKTQIDRSEFRAAARSGVPFKKEFLPVEAQFSHWLDDNGVKHAVFAIKFWMKIHAQELEILEKARLSDIRIGMSAFPQIWSA